MADRPEVKQLSEMVEYHDGSVVSKEILKKETGTVTLFAFSKGQGLSEHTAPFDALVTILDGTAQIKIGESKHSLESGDMIIMPASIPHAVHANEPFKMLLVMIKS